MRCGVCVSKRGCEGGAKRRKNGEAVLQKSSY